jgi:hypothetical protein
MTRQPPRPVPLLSQFLALWLPMLFLGSSGLVAWLGLRLEALWNLSCVVVNAWRIALSQVP